MPPPPRLNRCLQVRPPSYPRDTITLAIQRLAKPLDLMSRRTFHFAHNSGSMLIPNEQRLNTGGGSKISMAPSELQETVAYHAHFVKA
jgi:hypothetical protein